MKRKHGIILLVVAVIVAYIYLNSNVRERMENEKAPRPSKTPIAPRDVPVDPIAPA